MLVSVRSLVRQQAIEMNTSEFHASYEGTIPQPLFIQIVKAFFKKAVKQMYKGWTLHTPLGSFYIHKRTYNANNGYVSHAATRKVRKETGDNSIIVYRTGDFYYSYFYAPAKSHPHLSNYYFDPSWHNKRAIEENKETLKLHVV